GILADGAKNWLSGVGGAARVLEPGRDGGGRGLTRLICEEVDRVVALVDRVEMFADERPVDFGRVNIHWVLDRVRQIAEAGFGRGGVVGPRHVTTAAPVPGYRALLLGPSLYHAE